MGNKQTKVIYDKLVSAFEKEKHPITNLSMASLSEPELVKFLFDVIAKKLKDTDLQSFVKSCCLNAAPDDSKEEAEAKQKCSRESHLQTILVTGHEEQPEVKASFRNLHLEDAAVPRLSSVRDYTQQRVSEFVARLLLMLERAGDKEEATSFYQRLGKHLAEAKDDKPGESSGVSAALYFAALLIDPKRILTDTQISNKILSMFMAMQPLAFYGWTKQGLIIDKSIEYIKRSLLTQIDSSINKQIEIPKEKIENGIKILSYIGLARGSVEDLLLVIRLVREFPGTFDFADVLRKVLSLPEIETGVFSLQTSSLVYQIPFERIYIDKTSWITDKTTPISSAADTDYVYFYSPVHGLMLLGVGIGKIKGKIYEIKGLINAKGKIQLLFLNKKLYCWCEDKLFRVDPNTLILKESKKTSRVSGTENAKVTASGNTLVIYREIEKEEIEEGESFKVHADVYIHDLGTKAGTVKISIIHTIGDLQELVYYKNILILTGKSTYEAIDLVKNVTIKKEESSLLSHATICCNPDSNELFVVHCMSESDGFALGQFELIHLQRQSSPLLASKITQIKQLFTVDDKFKTQDQDSISKRELATLLGIYTEVEESKEKTDVYSTSKVEYLLAALADRASGADDFMSTVNTKDPKEIMRIYKSPLAVHLTVRCLETQFKLIEDFFKDFMEKKEDALEKLWYVIMILNEHFVAMGKCNISLGDCVGPEVAKYYIKICKNILIPLTTESLKEKYGLEENELIMAIKESAKNCINNSHALGESETEDTLKLLHESIKEFVSSKVMNKNLSGLISWLSVSDNIELLANRIINKNEDAIELLDFYFVIEVEFFNQMTQKFINNDTEIKPIQTVFKLISTPFTQVIERLFILIGKKVEKKCAIVQEQVITFLPNILHRHLKKLTIGIKETYSQYKKSLKDRMAELIKSNKLGSEYASYWKILDNLLNNELHLLNSFSMLTTLVMGLNPIPEQFISLAQLLMKSADELKELLGLLIVEDKDFMKDLEEIFENSDKPIRGTMSAEKEYKFPEASGILVCTVDEIDIPPPNKNEITIYEMPKNKVVQLLTRANPKCKVVVKGSHIKIAAKIDYVPTDKDIPYNGYKIRVLPKYVYGQKIIKSVLRKLLWAICYISNTALSCFESSSKLASLSKKSTELLESVLSSRLLSGGLPIEYFPTLFSEQFNKQYKALSREVELGGEIYSSNETMLTEIINGKDDKIEGMITRLNKECPTKHFTNSFTEEVVRMTFVLLLKITDSIPNYLSVIETNSEDGFKKLISLWSSATKMRDLFQKKRNGILSDHKEETTKEFQNIVKGVKDKVELLLKFRPAIHEELNSRIVKLGKTFYESSTYISEAETVKERLAKWKDIQLAATKEYFCELSSSVLTIQVLKSEITAGQLIIQLENYYLRAIVLYNVMKLMEYAITNILSKGIRTDVLAWIMSMFKRTSAAPWHYSQPIISCGTAFQAKMRIAFFGIIKQVLKYISLTKNSQELGYLMDALQWNYIAADHNDLNNCQILSTLRGKVKETYISSIWGQQIDNEQQISNILLDTFEFLVIKIVSRVKLEEMSGVSISKQNQSNIDESTLKLFNTIIEILFNEIKCAADSYNCAGGIESSLIEQYIEVMKEDTKKAKEEEDSSKDKKKIVRTFKDNKSIVYSHEFCVRLLGLMHRLLTAIQGDVALQSTLNSLIQSDNVVHLIRLLQIGSIQQQFVILQSLPLICTVSNKSLDQAARKTLEEKFTSSGTLDLLLHFILQRREGIWVSEVKSYSGVYSITKCAIKIAQLIIESNKDIGDCFWSIVKTTIFGGKEEWSKLPVEFKNRQLIEVMLSIAGGELNSLYKGASVALLDKKGYSVACFENTKETILNNEWELLPKKHNQAQIHLVGNEASIGKISLIKANISELIPMNQNLNLAKHLSDISVEQVEQILSKAINSSLQESTLLATIQVKIIRIIMMLLKEDKEMTNKLFNPELINTILELSLRKPKSILNRSLITMEFLIEEMRKLVSQSEGRTLDVPESNSIRVKIIKNEVMLILRTSSIVIPLIASKLTAKLSEMTFEYCEYQKDMILNNTAGKILFIEESYMNMIPEVSKYVKAIITDISLNKLVESKIPMAQINKKDMEAINSYKESLVDLDKFMQGNKPSDVIANYINIKIEKKIEAVDIRLILKELLDEKISPQSTIVDKEEKVVVKENPLRLFTRHFFKCDKMFKDKQNFKIAEETEQSKKTFSTNYGQIYERSEYATSDTYLDSLSDLKILYTRKLLLDHLSSVFTIKCNNMEHLIQFLLIMTMESDYLLYGPGYKELSKQVKATLQVVIKTEPNSLNAFIDWFTNGVKKMRTTSKKSSNLPGSKIEDLEPVVYVPFLYKYLHIFLKINPKILVTHERIGDIMTDLLTLVVLVDTAFDKYRCFLLLKEITIRAQQLQAELSVKDFNRLLSNKAMKTLPSYYKASDFTGSVLWKIANEVTLKANGLYRSSLERFGEQAITRCTNDDENLYAGVQIMKSFPSMKKLLTLSWIKMFNKELKVKNELRIDTPKPLYDTDYCILINDPCAQSITVNSKRSSTASGLISLDKELKAMLCPLDDEEEKFPIKFNRFYLHLPRNNFTVYTFGSNEGGRLGLKDLKNILEPKPLSRIGSNRIVTILSAGSHTIVVDSKDGLYSTGKGDGRVGQDSTTFNEYIKRDTSRICATNQLSSIFFDPGENQLHAVGKNPEKMFSVSSSNCNEDVIRLTEKDIREVSISSSHVLILYGDKTLHACPCAKKELFGTWIDTSDSKFAHVKLQDNIKKIKKVLAINTGTILLCTDSNTSKDELYSFGTESPGMGQGKTVSSKGYTRLSYAENIEFVELIGCENMAGAITKEGELYTWGKAYKGALGLYNSDGSIIEEANVPTKVITPDNTLVITASVGYNHTLVLAENKDTHKRILIGFGDNTKNQLGDQDVNTNKVILTFFEDKIPYLVTAGHSCSFVACGKKYNGIIHNDCKCEEHKEEIKEILYLGKTADNELKYYCKKCVLPDIVMTTRHPITQIKNKSWPLLDSLKVKVAEKKIVLECTACKDKIGKGVIYQSAIKDNASTICENCYLKTPSNFIPMIYYRIVSEELFDTKEFPVFSLSDFYEPSNGSLSLILTSNYKLELPRSIIEKEVKPSLEEFLDEAKAFTKYNDFALVDLLNDYITEENKDADKLSLKDNINLNYRKKTELSKFSDDALKRRTKTLIKLNKLVYKAIQSIDFETKPISEEDLYYYYTKVKDYIMIRTKEQICKKVISALPKTKGRTECVFDRPKAILLRVLGEVDHTGESSLYGQLWRALKEKVKQFCKPQKKGKYPFKIKFKGEDKTDVNELFRELINEICKELQSSILPLMIPTLNNQIDYGDYRDSWTLNPSANQPNHLEMLEFLGSLLGMSFRLSHVLPLSMSSTFWKQLIGDPVDRSDLKRSDAYCAQCLKDIANIDSSTFDSIFSNYFITRLSDGSEIELKKNGRGVKVTYENRHEYIELVEKARLEESARQIRAIKIGMFKIVPQSLIKLYSWRELEAKICGKPTFNIEALKKITNYSDCSEKDIHIQYFWKVLEQFTDDERSLYLRFVWGRSRMFPWIEGINHCLHIKETSEPDNTLPESHACLFQLDLPRYTSLEQTREKLFCAIRSCKSIDTDEDTEISNLLQQNYLLH